MSRREKECVAVVGKGRDWGDGEREKGRESGGDWLNLEWVEVEGKGKKNLMDPFEGEG